MNAPDLTFRSNVSPYSELTTIQYSQSKDGETFPILVGEKSDLIVFRIYNNWAINSSIATAHNVRIATYDGLGAISHTAVTSTVLQMWINFFQNGYGENSSQPGLLTFYQGDETAVGGGSVYYLERSSNGSMGRDIRAGTNYNGVGFIEVKSYALIPSNAGMFDFKFAITVIYDWYS